MDGVAISSDTTQSFPKMAKLNLAALATTVSILTGRSLAQSPTSSVVTLHLPNFDDQAILASVITANPTATSYLLSCPTDEPADECGLGTGINVLEGPSTLEVQLTVGELSSDVTCALNGDVADCDQRAVGPGGLTTMVIKYSGISSWAMPVTVTAGLESLTSGSDSSSSSSITSTGGGGGPTAPTGSATTPAPAGTGSTQTTSSSTAGMAAITGNPLVAGVAAILGAGMLVV
ncbi:hypothetical protein GE09DRAFT_1100006 [Coniochaeta sp. 2T2.1]|nr:hypothetical protein GE09DRAFT_1100006 [Coniochaeta sp. 2T2.1]